MYFFTCLGRFPSTERFSFLSLPYLSVVSLTNRSLQLALILVTVCYIFQMNLQRCLNYFLLLCSSQPVYPSQKLSRIAKKWPVNITTSKYKCLVLAVVYLVIALSMLNVHLTIYIVVTACKARYLACYKSPLLGSPFLLKNLSLYLPQGGGVHNVHPRPPCWFFDCCIVTGRALRLILYEFLSILS